MKIKKITLQILALLGLALSIKLAMIYYVANYQKYALASFCSVNDFIDCDGVARTTFSHFWGIPLAYWGMFLYITVLFLTFVDKLKNIKFLKFLEVFKNPVAYISVLGTFAFLISMILAGISIFKIHKLCVLCLITYFIDLVIALTASSAKLKNMINDFKTTFFDFADGVKQYKKTFIVLLILGISFLSYSNITYNFIPHAKTHKEFMKYRNMKKNPYRVNGNTLGARNGDVRIVLYSDYVCPMCYVHNIMLHKAVKEFKNVTVYHVNIPFDKACNKNISINMHPKACYMARAAISAGKQGNYWGMSSLLYEKQPKNSEELEELVYELNLNPEQFFKDLVSTEVKQELAHEIALSSKFKIDSTPTIFVNGKKYVGIMPYKKIQEILIENGAKREK